MSTASNPDQAADALRAEAQRVVARMGGPTKVAEFFGIRQPAVSQWLANGALPKARRRHLLDVRPDLFVPDHAANDTPATSAQP